MAAHGRGVWAGSVEPGEEGFGSVSSVSSARSIAVTAWAVVVTKGHGSGWMLNVSGYGRVVTARKAWSPQRERGDVFLSISSLDVADGGGVAVVRLWRCRESDELASSLGFVSTATGLLESSVMCLGRV